MNTQIMQIRLFAYHVMKALCLSFNFDSVLVVYISNSWDIMSFVGITPFLNPII